MKQKKRKNDKIKQNEATRMIHHFHGNKGDIYTEGKKEEI
jgi:hypothetical protein